jgi:hypothetical protein
MMLGLLVYSYATGTFSSRRIETLTHENVAVRYLCADTHPDHDSICKFRRENKELLEAAFERILHCAALSKVLRVGDITLAVDGTKILANASKHSALSHGHAMAQMVMLEEQIAQLLAKAEDADSTPLQDGLTVPDEIQRREQRLAVLKQATAAIEARAAERHLLEKQEHEEKLAAREAKKRETGRKPPGKPPVPPVAGPAPGDQINLTDADSRIMKTRSGWEQSYNAQAAVEVESRLIAGGHVVDETNDKRQLVPVLAKVSPSAGRVGTALTDSGYYSAAAVAAAEADGGPRVLAATGRQKHGRSVADLERRADPPPPGEGASPAQVMAWRLSTAEGKATYGLRKQTVEPVFGIIKEVLGFRRFSLRGLAKVNLEWTLVMLAYNLKRLWHMGAKLRAA